MTIIITSDNAQVYIPWRRLAEVRRSAEEGGYLLVAGDGIGWYRLRRVGVVLDDPDQRAETRHR